MKIKVISVLLIFLMCFSFIGCSLLPEDKVSNNQTSTSDGGGIASDNQLQIIKSDMKLSHEDVASRIKAEYLIENGGYKDDDPVVVMVNLTGESLLQSFLNNDGGAKTVADFALSNSGIARRNDINARQTSLINTLKSQGLISGVSNSYSIVMNAVAVTTLYGNLPKIESLSGVESVMLSDTFNRAELQSVEGGSAISNAVDVYPTGIYKSDCVEYTGKGTSVAVLDSGFDCSHPVFAAIPEGEVMFDQRDISTFLTNRDANAVKNNRGTLELSDVYYSPKIPYVYDYADKDPDVFPYDSNHGTHVAGIIGGQKLNTEGADGAEDITEFTGIAVDTQMVLMKVFPDLDTGADTEDIVAALEDAVLLGVDAINMSLGSSCGFSREEDNDRLNAVYDAINEAGISLVTAASNSYSSAYGGELGNTNKVTNPDSGTVGSPSTYHAALSVASISGVKSKYMVANGSQVVYFNESNSVAGKPNDFFGELGILAEGDSKTYEYVTVPGVGKQINYSSINVKGKIALVRRGDNTFEDKALQAKRAGAVACIIYNNIEGDILMSMGKTDHIPTISISKDMGEMLASKSSGTIEITFNNQAGPFMSDFSSWGPTPSLGLKPEITAHGGEIISSVPGGGYDVQSGTSMACPNLCGIVVLIRQYLKDNYSDLTAKQMSVMANQLLMSTATIVKNQDGNPYSPRKQGAGLASIANVVNTKAYLTVDGIDRAKLELGDDKLRTGKYEMTFNLVNLSNESLTYDLSTIGMTESVSTSDEEFVAERSKILDGKAQYSVSEGGSLSGEKVTVSPNGTAKIKVTYTLSGQDKKYIDDSFKYGMYVEGFVKLASTNGGVDLNIPFLAFYGDWTEAPMFDKTYYEVQSEAHDNSIDEEDKLKADYYATTPYGSYYYNYIIPLGTYLYDVDTNAYDPVPATEEHIAVSDILGTIDGIGSVYAGLLRNAKTMTYTITDKVTGEVVFSLVDYNAQKSYYNGMALPYYNYFKMSSYKVGLVNNRQYEFKMVGALDYEDGGLDSNVRNSFSFDFYMDNEAPVLREVTYEKKYDKMLKKDRYYINMTVYDNHYVQSITPIIFTSTSSYTFLSENPIPVYSEKGKDNLVRFEITDYLEDIFADELITSALAFSIDDYALNSNLYICQLPGTKGDFKFTKDGTPEGSDLIILSMYEGEVVDLTKYLSTTDETVDENKDYLKYLTWSSSNEKVATVKDGQVCCLSSGKATITALEQMDLKQAILIINVKERETGSGSETGKLEDDYEDSKIKSLRFSYFETLFAYTRAAQTSEIGETGSRNFLSGTNGTISFYPGEQIRLYHDFDPWYASSNYKTSYSSSDPTIATVDETGKVVGLKEGTTYITLSVEGSNISAVVPIVIKSEFVIENRALIAYKGLGGDVVIPDDEGIWYISSYAFCLYDTDNSFELPEDDFDANKIPQTNTTIKSVVIPNGVEEIQKYAFYNCTGLEWVSIPDSVKFIREFAFYNDAKLTTLKFSEMQNGKSVIRDDINGLSEIEVVGRNAFAGCTSLEEVNLSKTYAIGASAFKNCESLKEVDLTALRNAGAQAFEGCTALENVIMDEDGHTKLSYAMFAKSGLKHIDIYELEEIPSYCFAQCENLESVTLHNDLTTVGYGAFCECPALTSFASQKIEIIGGQAFYEDTALEKFTLPNCEVELGEYAFYKCENLTTLAFDKNTKLNGISGSIFADTSLTTFEVHAENANYKTSGHLLLNGDGNTVIFGAVAHEYGDYTLDGAYEFIANSAFSGANITKLTITNPNTVIGDYAFANCASLQEVIFPAEGSVVIGDRAFYSNEGLTSIKNLNVATKIGEYAFANVSAEEVEIGANVTAGEGAFFQSKLKKVSIGENSEFGLGAFQNCKYLAEVVMPEAGGVMFGEACFANDVLLNKIDLTKAGKVISDEAFYGCTSLTEANLANVEVIGEYAFADCKALLNIKFPVVKKIGIGAFSRYSTFGGAPTVERIVLPDSLEELGDGAFLGCEGLTYVKFPEGFETKASEQMNEDGSFDADYVGEYNTLNYTFAYCLNLSEVILPESLKYIGTYAFSGCERLNEINLASVEYFGDFAFTSSTGLNTVDLSSAVEIGYGAFASTSASTALTSESLLVIDTYAFQGAQITELNAPNLKVLDDASFDGNVYLTSVVIPRSLELFGSAVFIGCTALQNFTYQDGANLSNNGTVNDYIQIEEGILYTKMQSGKWQLSSVPAGKNISELVVREGTYRIDVFAGNQNENVKKVVLPNSLKLIGNYAFYGYKSLEAVEFRSITAPALEDYYNADTVLEEDAPGYDKLHEHFDLFGLELYYYTFIDLVGREDPIKMILPANQEVYGYDSLVYEVYFGDVQNAERSEYMAMQKEMVDFIAYAEKIAKITNVKLNDEDLINKALTAYKAITQNYEDYEIPAAEWNTMVECVTKAKEVISGLKLENSSQKVKDLQARINVLPQEFSLEHIELLKVLANDLSKLKVDEKSILDLTKYNQLLASYESYKAQIENTYAPLASGIADTFTGMKGVQQGAMAMAFAAIFAIVKRKFFI